MVIPIRYSGVVLSFRDLVIYNLFFILQKRIVRILAGVSSRCSCRGLFKRLNILTLPCLYIYEILCFVRKKTTYFPNENTEDYCYDTRRKHDFKTSKHRSTLFENSCKYNCQKMYNHLPSDIKNTPQFKKYKSRIFNYLVQQEFYNVCEFFNHKM